MTLILSFLSLTVIVQFALIMVLMSQKQEFKEQYSNLLIHTPNHLTDTTDYSGREDKSKTDAAISIKVAAELASWTVSMSNNDAESYRHTVELGENYEGVAVATFLGAPKNRYSMMVNQILAVIDDRNLSNVARGGRGGGWIVQIFYHPDNKMSVEGTMYPGIQRLIKRGRVVLTPIPLEFKKMKRKMLLLQPWLWSSMLAERVLLFGGNVVLCSNSHRELSDFSYFDYIGTPWSMAKGLGGEGDLSMRNRTKMLEVLKSSTKEEISRAGSDREDLFFVKKLLNMQTEQEKEREKGDVRGIVNPSTTVAIATQSDTRMFAMSSLTGVSTLGTFGASGTLIGLNDSYRQTFINYCPELKMIFPSLHSPHCFGADPSPLDCFRYLCQAGGLNCRNRINKNSGGALTVSWKDVRNSDNLEVTMNLRIEMILPT